jgi:DNA-binding CsgD family transcriptional regulator
VPNLIPPQEDAKIIAYFREGLTVQDIANVEQMSFHTVKSRVTRLYEKYGARNRAQLLALYADEQRAAVVRDELLTRQLSQLLTQWLNVARSDQTVGDALQLAYDVRFAPSTQTRLRLRRYAETQPDRLVTLVMTLAALVPLDRSPDVALRWLLDRQITANGRTRNARSDGSSIG